MENTEHPNLFPVIAFDGPLLRVTFDRFDLPAYDLFLKVKKLPESTIAFDRVTEFYTVTAPARFAPMLGVVAPVFDQARPKLADHLFDDQREIVADAIAAERFACWSDCGLGKTPIGLEFARQVIAITAGRVLIVTLNEVVPQWLAETFKFYGDTLPILRLETREEMREWCRTGTITLKNGAVARSNLAVTNYEKFNHKTEADQKVPEIGLLAGVILDESSRLKTGGGKQKWAIIKSARGVRLKLSLTATPAPNEIMEFASQASFLEKMRSQEEIIWTFFRRDPKTHRWTVRPHARAAFFEFMSSWSIYVRDPRAYGWRKDIAVPPPPEMFHYALDITAEQRIAAATVTMDPKCHAGKNAATLLPGTSDLNAIAASKLAQIAKGFIYSKGGDDEVAGPEFEADADPETGDFRPARTKKNIARVVTAVPSNKPKFVADLIAGEAADGTGRGLSTLVWCVFDEEIRILSALLAGSPFTVETLTGRTKTKDRAAIIDRFKAGETRVLIARADMLGFGMNFQHVRSMVFSGWTFSYESFYQAIRRAVRFKQEYAVRVHVPGIPELEGQMWDAIVRKGAQFEASIAEMEANYIRARNAARAIREAA